MNGIKFCQVYLKLRSPQKKKGLSRIRVKFYHDCNILARLPICPRLERRTHNRPWKCSSNASLPFPSRVSFSFSKTFSHLCPDFLPTLPPYLDMGHFSLSLLHFTFFFPLNQPLYMLSARNWVWWFWDKSDGN